jgi:hypothetical protein
MYPSLFATGSFSRAKQEFHDLKDPARELVGILVLEKRHFRRTFGAALGRQIEHEVVLH